MAVRYLSALGTYLSDSFFHKKSTSNRQIDALDGLRGIAVLLVLLSHMSNNRMLSIGGFSLSGTGKYGVYLFFVLSAFLLTLPLINMPRQRFASPRVWLHYAARRILRIYPLFAVVLVAHHMLGSPYFSPLDWQGVVGHLGLSQGVGIYWAIPVEVTYYLVLPFVAATMVFLGRRFLPVLALMAITLILVCGVIWPESQYQANTIILWQYLPAFLLGSLTAFLHSKMAEPGWLKKTPTPWILEAIGIALLLLLVTMTPSIWSMLAEQRVTNGHFHPDLLLFGALWGAVILATLHGKGYLRWFFTLKPLRFMGVISFSVYLWHMPIMLFIKYNAGPNLRSMAVVLAVVLCAMISYLLIERPFLSIHIPSGRPNRS